MLIRWATSTEKKKYGFNEFKYKDYDVLIAINRMTNECLGILGFSREEKKISEIKVFSKEKETEIESNLIKCANNQIEPKGGSFHYRFPQFAEESLKEKCPCCNALPMPDGMEEIAVLDYSWVTVEPSSQGRLFGKCVVGAKYHSVFFYDMPKEEMANFMSDVQKVAEVLHKVTGAVKINYEMHCNSAPHLHCHLFPRYIDDDFPSAPIDYRITKPSPYESEEEYRWFINEMRSGLNKL
jgi:diadenosine tetraphosphate (Ap4A) HIT family hydrolase